MTLAASSAVSRLAEISGPANTTGDPARLAAYEIDAVAPGALVKPASREEISEIVKFCFVEKLSIVPCGARSKLSMGAPPIRYDVALDMTRLDRIVAYDPSDLTLSVEPGIPLQRLAGVLAGHRQFLPLAVPFLGRTTAGGTIASGVYSPLRQAYGTARDFLLGVDFITGEGAHAKSGGLVVKNVAGYDLHKLMIGALGTLGIITKLNFRTFPAPAATRVFCATCETPESAFELRRAVAHSPLRPLSVDILSPGAVAMLSSEIAARIEPGPTPVDHLRKDRWAILMTYSGNVAVLNRYESDMKKMAEATGCGSPEIFGDEKNRAPFGRWREFVPIAMESSAAAVVMNVSVLPSKWTSLINSFQEAAQASRLRWAACIGGLGVGYVALLPEMPGHETQARVQGAAAQTLDACARAGGNGSSPWCPAEWKQSLKIWGPERADLEQMRRLKKIFDPAGILAPGRFAGGI